MSRFLCGAVTRVLGHASDPRPYSGLYLASSSPPAAGHLGLVRARPGLADLKSLLTPEALLLDATHALGAAALRVHPITGATTRRYRDAVAKEISEAEAEGNARGADLARILMALVDAEDGRFEDALDALSRLAEESPGRMTARLCAAAVCYALGRVEEGDKWLASVPGLVGLTRPCEDFGFQLAMVAATLGGGAVADSEGRVASAAFPFANEKLWESVIEGDMSLVKKLLVTGLLKRVANKAEHKDAVALFSVLKEAKHSRHPFASVYTHHALKASQALLFSAVLRAQPLSGERVRAALRVAERELARAVEEGDAAAVSDLRLLVALLAARDGRFDVALERYAEAARDEPSDPRPHYLAFQLSLLVGRMEEHNKWEASYERLDQGSLDSRAALKALSDEMLVAQALGGSPLAFRQDCPNASRLILGAAASRVDAALVSALRGQTMPMVKRLQVRAVRAFLHAEVWSALKDLKSKGGCSSTATN